MKKLFLIIISCIFISNLYAYQNIKVSSETKKLFDSYWKNIENKNYKDIQHEKTFSSHLESDYLLFKKYLKGKKFKIIYQHEKFYKVKNKNYLNVNIGFVDLKNKPIYLNESCYFLVKKKNGYSFEFHASDCINQ